MGKIFFYFKLIFSFLILTGCSQSFYAPAWILEIQMPDWPPSYGDENEYPELSKWKLEVAVAESGKDGSLSRREKIILDGEEKNYFLELPYFSVCSVSAQPVTYDSDGNEILFFYPAGMIYPFCNEKLEWESGFEAKVLQTIICGSENSEDIYKFVSRFNWKKMDDYLKEKIFTSINENEKFYNPWKKNVYEIAKEITEKKFTASDLNINNTSMIELESPGNNQHGILSPFVIENENIKKCGRFCILNGEINFYSIYNRKCVIIYADNKSIRFAKLPLFVE